MGVTSLSTIDKRELIGYEVPGKVEVYVTQDRKWWTSETGGEEVRVVWKQIVLQVL